MRRLCQSGELDVWYARLDARRSCPSIRPGRSRRRPGDGPPPRRRAQPPRARQARRGRDGLRRIRAIRRWWSGRVPRRDRRRAKLSTTTAGPLRGTKPLARPVPLRRRHPQGRRRRRRRARCFSCCSTDADPNNRCSSRSEADPVRPRGASPPGPYAPGHRVVAGQRLLQALRRHLPRLDDRPRPRLLLASAPRHEGYRRPRRRWAGRLRRYAGLPGAPSPAPTPLRRPYRPRRFLGRGDTFDRAVADFALRYTEQNAADHRPCARRRRRA